jgi:hypothetical protein
MTPAPLPIGVDLGPGLSAAAVDGGVRAVVAAVLGRLGIPLRAELTYGESDSGLPVSLTVDGAAVPIARATFAAAWLAVAPESLRDRAGDAGVQLADLTDVPTEVAAAFVARAVEGALNATPASLAGPALTAAYAGGPAPPGLDEVVRSLLEQGVAIADRAVIVGRVEAGHQLDLGTLETAEVLVARLRPATVGIHVAAAEAPVYGLDPAARRSAPVEAIPGSDEAVVLETFAGALHAQAGIAIPMLEWRLDDELPPGTVAIAVNSLVGLPVPLAAAGPPCETDLQTRSVALGVAYVEIVRLAHRILDLEEVEAKLGLLSVDLPSLAQAAGARITPAEVTVLLRSLMRERVPVANLAEVLERALDFDSIPADPAAARIFDDRLPIAEGRTPQLEDLVEYVRRRLRTVLTARHAGTAGRLPALVIDPALEQRVRTLDPAAPEAAAVRAAVWAAAGDHPGAHVLITRRGGRAALSRVLGCEQGEFAVLDEAEIADGTQIEALAEVALP